MSSWTDHVKKVAKEKGISYKDALKVAGETYKKPETKAVSKPKQGDKPKPKKRKMLILVDDDTEREPTVREIDSVYRYIQNLVGKDKIPESVGEGILFTLDRVSNMIDRVREEREERA